MVVDHNKEGGLNQIVFAIEIIDEARQRENPALGDRKITISLGAAIFTTKDNCSFAELYFLCWKEPWHLI